MCTYRAVHCVSQTTWARESKQVWLELPYTISCLEEDLFAVEYNVVSRCLLSDEVFASLKPQFLSGDIMREELLYSMDLLPTNSDSIEKVLTTLNTPTEPCPLNTAVAEPFDILKELATFWENDNEDLSSNSASEQTLVSTDTLNLLRELENFGNSDEQQMQVLPEFSVCQGSDGQPVVNIDGGALLVKLTQPETSAVEDVERPKRKRARKLIQTETSPEEDVLSVWLKSPYVLHYAYKDVSSEDSLITSVALVHAHQNMGTCVKKRVSFNRQRQILKHIKSAVNSFCKIFSVPSNAGSEMLKEALAKQDKTLVLYKSLENLDPASGKNIIAVVCSPCGMWFPGSHRLHSWIINP
jgi:hypothetical protein